MISSHITEKWICAPYVLWQKFSATCFEVEPQWFCKSPVLTGGHEDLDCLYNSYFAVHFERADFLVYYKVLVEQTINIFFWFFNNLKILQNFIFLWHKVWIILKVIIEILISKWSAKLFLILSAMTSWNYMTFSNIYKKTI